MFNVAFKWAMQSYYVESMNEGLKRVLMGMKIQNNEIYSGCQESLGYLIHHVSTGSLYLSLELLLLLLWKLKADLK